MGVAIVDKEEGSFEFDTDKYTITVSYTKEAEIPIGTKLIVKQISSNSDEYGKLWDQTILELNGHDLSLNELNPSSRIGLTSALFFDISLIKEDGEEFEPKVPLHVNIHLKNGGLPQFNGETSGIIHFGKKGTEVIENVELGDSNQKTYEGMPDGVLINNFSYNQEGFSAVGAYTTGVYHEAYKAVNMSFAPLRTTSSENKIVSSKSVTDEDEDGIFDLKLSVTGTSNKTQSETLYKSNIVLVIDVSGSMDGKTPEAYTYNQYTYNDAACYGTYNGNEVQVYYINNRWYRFDWDAYDWREYTGHVYRYTGPTRMEATKAAAKALVTELLKSNTTETDKDNIVEISVIKFASLNEKSGGYWDGPYYVEYFYNGTEVLISESTSESAIHKVIDDITEGGGTNWEAALIKAKEEVDKYPIQTIGLDGKTKVVETNNVIFLTDGLPTLYVRDNGNEDGDGDEGTNNVDTCFNQAYPYADDLVNTAEQEGTDCTFYSIFAYGQGDRGINYLRRLTNYAYDTSSFTNTADNEHCFDATDTTALQQAFQKISDTISSNVGFGGVQISDGLSVGSTNSTIAVDGTVHPEYFLYTVYDEDGETVLYTVTFDTSGNATFKDDKGLNLTPVTKKSVTTELPAPTETNPDATKTVTKDVYSVTVGAGAAAKTYMMTPAEVTTAGMIDWNLSGLGILEKWTYELSFKVWPNQAAYDIAADLNNGLHNNDLDTAIADYVSKGLITATEGERLKTTMVIDPTTGKYVINTNYSQEISYHQASVEQVEGQDPVTEYGDPQIDPILPIPNPIPLQGSLIPMQKKWGSELAMTELQELVFGKDNTYTGYKVKLKLTRDGQEYMHYTFPKLDSTGHPVDKDGNVSTDVHDLIWEQNGAIAPGRLVSKDPGGGTHRTVTLTGDKAQAAGIAGTYYIINDGHEYKISEEEGGDLHFEFSTDDYHPMLVDGDLMNIKFNSVGTNGKIDTASTAEVIDVNMTTVYATNTLKGGLNIRKTITDESQINAITGCKDEFTFEVTLTKDGTTAYSTPTDQYSTTKPAEYDQANHGGWSYDEDAQLYYISGFSAYNIFERNGNNELVRTKRGPIPTTGKLTLTMPADGEIRIVNLPTGTNYTVKEIVDENGGYDYLKTVSQVKTNEDGAGVDVFEGDPVETTANTVSGTISGNRAKVETYWNWASNFYVYHSSDNTIEKISFADSRVKTTYDAETGKYNYEFNILNETKSGCLYGGYYKEYGGTNATKEQLLALSYENTDAKTYTYDAQKRSKTSTWATDTSSKVKAYTKDDGSTITWSAAQAYSKLPGNAMAPSKDTIYYLKEVPNTFLLPKVFRTFKTFTHNLTGCYLTTSVDDANYRKVGFMTTIGSKNADATLYKKVGVNWENNATPEDDNLDSGSTPTTEIPFGRVDATDKFGYIAMADNYCSELSSAFEANNGSLTMTLAPYFVTPDGVRVLGTSNRQITITDTVEVPEYDVTAGDKVIQWDEMKFATFTYGSRVKVVGKAEESFTGLKIEEE